MSMMVVVAVVDKEVEATEIHAWALIVFENKIKKNTIDQWFQSIAWVQHNYVWNMFRLFW
jgi:hypothetical protein